MMPHDGDDFLGSEGFDVGDGFTHIPIGGLKQMKEGLDACLQRKGMKESGKRNYKNFVYARAQSDRAQGKK